MTIDSFPSESQTDFKSARRARFKLPIFVLAGLGLSLTACTNVDNQKLTQQTDTATPPVAEAELVPGLTVEPSTKAGVPESDQLTADDTAEANTQTREVVTDVPTSEIVAVRFIDTDDKNETRLEKQGWIDPLEKVMDSDDELVPSHYNEAIEITTNAGMYDSKGNLKYFSHELGLDEQGQPIGRDDLGNEVPFFTVFTYHSWADNNKKWFPNDITQLNSGASIEIETKEGLIVKFRLVDNKQVDRVGPENVWQGFDQAITGTDMVTTGCLIEIDDQGGYSRTQQIQVGRFEFADAKLI